MADTTQSIQTKFYHPELTVTRTMTVASGATIYEGQLVGIDGSGYAANVTTSTKIAGIAKHDAVAGDTLTIYFGMGVELALSGAAITNIGNTAYAADNQTAQTSSNTAILGPIIDVGTNTAKILLTLRA